MPLKTKKLGDKANKVIDSYFYSSPHFHHLIALAITILEIKSFGREYAIQTISNANALGKAFSDLDYDVRIANTGNYSENHQVHIFIDEEEGYLKLYKNLIKNNISTNFDRVLGEKIFIRLGTQEVTRRGMKEKEMSKIALFIDSALKGNNVKKDVVKFNSQFRNIYYSFD